MHFQISSNLQKGQGYFYKRREKYQCTVFKVNMGVKGIHVCDKKGIRVLFNMEKVSILYLCFPGLLNITDKKLFSHLLYSINGTDVSSIQCKFQIRKQLSVCVNICLLTNNVMKNKYLL